MRFLWGAAGWPSLTHRLPETAFAVLHPMERVVRALGRQLDAIATPLASYEEWPVNFRHRVIPQLLLPNEFRRSSVRHRGFPSIGERLDDGIFLWGAHIGRMAWLVRWV